MRGVGLIVLAGLSLAAAPGYALDERAADALVKASNCLNCHSLTRAKEGPSFKETAAKYKGNPEAQAILTKQITTGPVVKVDGKDEKHGVVKSTDAAEISNLVQWILSR